MNAAIVWFAVWLVASCVTAYTAERQDDVSPVCFALLAWPLLLALAVVSSPIVLAHWLGERARRK